MIGFPFLLTDLQKPCIRWHLTSAACNVEIKRGESTQFQSHELTHHTPVTSPKP